MTRPVIFVVIAIQLFLFVLTSAQIVGKPCCVESWEKYIRPLVDFLKKNPKSMDFNNTEFKKAHKIWNDSFVDYNRGAPDDICNGVLLYKCKSDKTCVCNDNQEDGLAVVDGNGDCVVETKGGFCDKLKFHRCKVGLVCVQNPKYGGNFSHCVDPKEEEEMRSKIGNGASPSGHMNFYGLGFFFLISLFTMWQKVIFN